jgi:alpha 1,3-glucosidase
VQWLDLDACFGRAPFEWDHAAFPNPKEITDALSEKQRCVVRISDVNLPIKSDHIQYQEAKKARYFIRTLNGQDDWVGTCWPGQASWLDFLNLSASHWWGSKYYYGEGRDFTTNNTFYWNDMNEPAVTGAMDHTFPKDGRHINGLEIRQTHSIYGLCQAAASSKGEMERDVRIGQKRKRPFVLTQSWFAGAQKYAFAWTGDNSPSWDHLQKSLSEIVVCGLNSMPFIGSDVGGYGGNPSDELEVRWQQAATWTYPFYRSHSEIGTKRREPWMFESPTRERVTKAIKDRYLTLAYRYTQSVFRTRIGHGPLAPLWLEWPEVDAYHDNEREFLFGDSIVVAPVVDKGATQIHVLKPPGVWYCFWSGDIIKGDVTRNVTLDDIPVLLRGGKIIPLYETPGDSSLLTLTTPITLRIATDEQGHASGSLYLDDGVSFDFEGGEFLERNFTYDKGVLRSKKGNTKERKVPSLLENNYITSLEFYLVKPDGTSEVRIIRGLHLLVRDEWEWRESSSIGGSSEARHHSIVVVVSIACTVAVSLVILGVVIGIMTQKKRKDAELLTGAAPSYT